MLLFLCLLPVSLQNVSSVRMRISPRLALRMARGKSGTPHPTDSQKWLLIKPFLCFFKRVLQRDAEYFHYTTPRVRKQPARLCGGSEVTMPAEGLVPVSLTILAQ